ncbi:hypothetical protein EMPS_10747 [Entomortierella parvispora]|uniref:Uncharacterized protein n=1 Tax=Entomortierella parvispora TaxID=205924 RepID=A0A9P3HKW9_9FUNG|nr:hypothetical protein EMPS_10747 [Entomortierella parvispora]
MSRYGTLSLLFIGLFFALAQLSLLVTAEIACKLGGEANGQCEYCCTCPYQMAALCVTTKSETCGYYKLKESGTGCGNGHWQCSFTKPTNPGAKCPTWFFKDGGFAM